MRKVPRHRPPVRDYVVELTTVSRNIEAQIVMTSRGTFRSAAGNLFLDLLSVLFSPQYDRVSRLDTDTRCGRTEMHMLESLHGDPGADSAWCTMMGFDYT